MQAWLCLNRRRGEEIKVRIPIWPELPRTQWTILLELDYYRHDLDENQEGPGGVPDKLFSDVDHHRLKEMLRFGWVVVVRDGSGWLWKILDEGRRHLKVLEEYGPEGP